MSVVAVLKSVVHGFGEYEVSVVPGDVSAVAGPHPCDKGYLGCTRVHLRGGQTLYVYASPAEVYRAIGWVGPTRPV